MWEDVNHVYVCLRENCFHENVKKKKKTLGLNVVACETLSSIKQQLCPRCFFYAFGEVKFEINSSMMIVNV